MNALVAGLVSAVILGLGGWFPSPPTALPVAPPLSIAPVAGIPEPCPARHPWHSSATPAVTRTTMEQAFGLQLTGAGWTDPANRPLVKIVWETLDAVSCTSYLDDVRRNSGQRVIRIHAGPTRSWAWGDWGLTNPGRLTFDFAKWHSAYPSDKGRLVRIVIHELGHMHQMKPAGHQADLDSFRALYSRHGGFSKYGRGSSSETMSEVIGYYVSRCALDNPYDRAGASQRAYYEWAKNSVFKGVEFGPAPGVRPEC
ncbi:hypothetical protein [Aestuariimicrobium sp. T2.26MG-19.2B]|uniref:hypothetical protein n=1 Tax=Aestuariimicrobium sp. T2.26MG-19.2B TaxID=3040679 RepID=UPI0024776D84|nr:hypothetical protein [Aestuariimicrobium sp. T2.26MG-19.2B]CAI9404045.1 hypothetical protein AESSP_01128 [Aestuariimicrobium sp. T2.26MG-19.2B]